MKANISIDVSLLAIVLAMYMTKQDNRMILVLIAALVTHVLMTSEYDESNGRRMELGMGQEDDSSVDDSSVDDSSVDDSSADGTDQTEELEMKNPRKQASKFSPENHVKTTVSSGVFERRISTPQAQMTSTIFPSTSSEANGKLAEARGSFFETLVS